MERSDEQLVRNYLEGEVAALGLILDRYLEPIYRFVYRLTGQADDASDIAQEVFVKVWRNLRQFDQTKNFKTWLFAIARHATIDWWRRQKVPVFSDLVASDNGEDFAAGIADPAPLPDELFQHAESRERLERALAQLPVAYRTVVVLHQFHDLTFAAIAEVTGQSLNTVKSQYRRAGTKLAASLVYSPSNG